MCVDVEVLEQVTVFLENRPGRLQEVVRLLADRGVNLRALSIAETERFGLLRIIPDDLEDTLAALDDAEITHRVTRVVGVRVPDRAGGLAAVLDLFTGTDVSIAYMYAELSGGEQAMLVVRFEPQEEALRILAEADLG